MIKNGERTEHTKKDGGEVQNAGRNESADQGSSNGGDTQPRPTRSEYEAVGKRLIREIRERMAIGLKKYDTHLQPFNGRNARKDSREEVLDEHIYNTQIHMEQEIREACTNCHFCEKHSLN